MNQPESEIGVSIVNSTKTIESEFTLLKPALSGISVTESSSIYVQQLATPEIVHVKPCNEEIASSPELSSPSAEVIPVDPQRAPSVPKVVTLPSESDNELKDNQLRDDEVFVSRNPNDDVGISFCATPEGASVYSSPEIVSTISRNDNEEVKKVRESNSAFNQIHSLYLRAKCKVMDVIRTRLMQSPHSFEEHDKDVWILGKCHRWRPTEFADEQEKQVRLNAIMTDLQSRLWITYRKNFPPIMDFTGMSTYTSDSGWGCMIRTTQMLMANALIFHTLSRDWILNKDKRQGINYQKILRYFIDLPSSRCILSIHNMMKNGVCFRKPAGVWFTPSEALHMASSCLNSSSLDSIVSLIAREGIVYLDEVRKACEAGTRWRSLILLIPLRLGLEKINVNYTSALLNCLELPWSLGFVGGKPNRSLYFVGKHNSHLIYLDPHITREALPIDTDLGSAFPQFHCELANSLLLEELDPSLALGFYFRNREQFKKFWETGVGYKNLKFPVFTCEPEKPQYSEYTGWNEEETSNNEVDEKKMQEADGEVNGSGSSKKNSGWIIL